MLPSFLAGAILADEDLGEGRAVVAERVAVRRGTTPLGLHRAPSLHRSKITASEWGRDASRRCPFAVGVENPGCGIWRYRNGVCATWFCLHDRGPRGERAWAAIRDFLSYIESSLALDCALSLGVGPAAVSLAGVCMPLEPDDRSLFGFVDPAGVLDDALRARLWGTWLDREADFYRACWERIRSLPYERAATAGGARLESLRRRAQDAVGLLRGRQVPLQLSRGNVEVTSHWAEVSDGSRWYGDQDYVTHPLRVRAETLAAIDYSGSLDPASLVSRLHAYGDADATEETVRELYDWGLLVPTGQAPRRLDRPVRPDDRLRVAPNARFNAEVVFAGDRPSVHVTCGTVKIEIEDADLLFLSSALGEHQHGFSARDVCGWAGSTLAWERAAEVLDGLLGAGVLEPLETPGG